MNVEVRTDRLEPAASHILAAAERLLAAYDPLELKSAERLIEVFARQPHTVSGFPRVRPADCARITIGFEKILQFNASLFRMADSSVSKRFASVIEAFAETEIRSYPGELQRLQVLLARARLISGDVAGAHALVGPLASKPYSIEMDFFRMADVLALDLQCRTALGDVEDAYVLAIQRVKMLTRLHPLYSWSAGWRFANFLGLQAPEGYRRTFSEGLAHKFAKALSDLRRRKAAFFRPDPFFIPDPRKPRKRTLEERGIEVVAYSYGFYLGLNLAQMTLIDLIFGKKSDGPGDIVATRAMGGIGDLLMMTPGLRALAKRTGKPVKFVTPRKFFGVFANNPNVDLIDMDGPPVKVFEARRWFNLSVCPATAYEAPIRPFAKKGRVELFARGLSVKGAEFARTGQKIDIVLTDEERAFAREFATRKGIGQGRPVVGVQPFSREDYRNYPHMNEVISRLADACDVVIFHHRSDGLPEGNSICTTAGLSLRQSFALGEMLDVLVTVDSSFLHVAGAFDIPTVALFGPIDGRIRTQHLKRVEVVDANAQFPCAPCWRNEDEKCHVTLNTGASPCLAAITPARVVERTRALLEKAPKGRAA